MMDQKPQPPPPAPNLVKGIPFPDIELSELAAKHHPSVDNPDKPLNLHAYTWDLVSAISLIRELQPQAHKLGFNLALGGGVLNNGSSSNDLDLIAIPRPALPESNLEALLENFEMGKRDPVEIFPPKRTVYQVRYLHLGHHDRPYIDLIVFHR